MLEAQGTLSLPILTPFSLHSMFRTRQFYGWLMTRMDRQYGQLPKQMARRRNARLLLKVRVPQLDLRRCRKQMQFQLQWPLSLKMTTKPLWKLKIREAIIDASAQAIDPRHPVISGFFVQVSTSPCPRCRFEVIDGMLSCGQCAYIIQGKKTSQRDSVITTTSCRISFEDRRRARDES